MKDTIILFDLDDTLVIEYESAQEAFLNVCRGLADYGMDPSAMSKTVQEKARELWHGMPTYEYCLRIGISSWEGLWANFIGEHPKLKELNSLRKKYQVTSWLLALNHFGIDSKTLAEEFSDRFHIERRKLHKTFEDTFETLDQLSKSYRLGLITNGTPDLQREKIRGSGIGSYFENILISGEVDHAKPDKEIFLMAAEYFQVSPAAMIMIGDSIGTDIIGSNNAGMQSVWINRKNKKLTGETVPTRMIHKLIELPDLLPDIIRGKTSITESMLFKKSSPSQPPL